MNPEEKKQLFKAKDSVYRLLKYRPRSEKEIYDKLTQKNFSESIINKSIAYFKDIELIDDRQFAKRWISSRLAKPYGLKRIGYELKQKGINKDILHQEIAFLQKNIDEENIVKKLAQKRKKKYTHLSQLKTKQRLYMYLARRGFDSYAINKAIKDL